MCGGTITAAITQESQLVTGYNREICAAVLGIGNAHAVGKTKVLRELPNLGLVRACEPNGELRQQRDGETAHQGALALDERSSRRCHYSTCRRRILSAKPVLFAGHSSCSIGRPKTTWRGCVLSWARLNADSSRSNGYMWLYRLGIHTAIEAARKGYLSVVYLLRGNISSDTAPFARPA